MPNTKISDMTSAGSLSGTELVPVVRFGDPTPNRKSTVQDMALFAMTSETTLRVLETSDTGWSVNFGSASTAVVASHGNLNNFVGYVLNDLPNDTGALPVAVVGYRKIAAGSDGNHVFGVYGLAEMYATGGGNFVGAEFTARNYSGQAPDANLPPDTSFGTEATVGVAANFTCGTGLSQQNGAAPLDCSIGIYVTNESGNYSDRAFLTGIYVAVFRTYGIYVGAQPSGNQASVFLDNNGTGINLVLGTSTAIVPANSVIDVVDNAATHHFNVKQDGTVNVLGTGTNGFSLPPTGIMSIGQTVATTVGAAGGASALPATPTGYINILVNGVAKKIPYYDP